VLRQRHVSGGLPGPLDAALRSRSTEIGQLAKFTAQLHLGDVAEGVLAELGLAD
jgi:hypothetical protein